MHVFWVEGPWPGRLGIVPRPRGGALTDEAAAWRAAGIDVVVSLLEPEEVSLLGLEGEAAAAAAHSVVFRACPIPDGGIPPFRHAVAELIAELIDTLQGANNVAIHCRQSIGRSGMVVCGVLVAAGVDLAAALRVVAEARGVEVPETEEQRQWLREFAAWLASAAASTEP
jgi:protein-tyrosine phosphatase